MPGPGVTVAAAARHHHPSSIMMGIALKNAESGARPPLLGPRPHSAGSLSPRRTMSRSPARPGPGDSERSASESLRQCQAQWDSARPGGRGVNRIGRTRTIAAAAAEWTSCGSKSGLYSGPARRGPPPEVKNMQNQMTANQAQVCTLLCRTVA